jgi:hypothetical protein
VRGERGPVRVERHVPELDRAEEIEVPHEDPRRGGLRLGDPVEELERRHAGGA